MISEMSALKRVIRLLAASGRTLSVAESCTGGALAKALTDPAGSSSYFLGGVTAYSNTMKTSFLGVNPATIARFGAVSEETCREMCLGIRDRAGSSDAVSVTGIAGPSGGTPEKPVGTVYAGFCVGDEVTIRKYRFNGNRAAVRRKTVSSVLMDLAELLGQEEG
jgi:PncC family amidohydrolase